MSERMTPLEACLGGALKAGKLWQHMAVMRLFEAWPTVVGRRIADNTKLLKVEPPVVRVAAFTSPWLQQLQMRKPQLLKKINDYYGGLVITEMELVMYRHSFVKEEEDAQKELLGDIPKRVKIDASKTVLSEAEVADIEQSVAVIDDPALAATIRKVRINQAKKERVMAAKGYHRCRHCGLWIEGERPLCMTCLHKVRRSRVIAVKEVLQKYPFAKLDEVRRMYGWCDQDLYGEAKRESIYLYLRKSYEGTKSWADLYTAAMLITGKRREELTPEFVINLTNKYLPDEKKRKVVTP